MKKIISIVIAAACVLALFAGCSAKANVSLDGSTSMEKVINSTPAPHIHKSTGSGPASRPYLKHL